MLAVALPSHPKPKPHPIFGHASTSDNKNSLLAPTLASILVDAKPAVTAAIKVASGKQACCMKAIKVKQGLGNRRVKTDRQFEDGVVKGKVGRTQGVVNWLDEDFTAPLDVVEALFLECRRALGAVYSHFEAWVKEHGHPVHSESTLEKQFKVVSLGFIASMD